MKFIMKPDKKSSSLPSKNKKLVEQHFLLKDKVCQFKNSLSSGCLGVDG